MAKKKDEAEEKVEPLHDAGIILFRGAVEAAGLEPLEEGETVETYVDREGWGANTRARLAAAVETARALNKQITTDLVQAARQHHDDPNPPDTPTLKK